MSAALSFAPQGYTARHELNHALVRRDGDWLCFYCGRVANSVDHVTARFHGGSDNIKNLVLCCWPCNDEKNTTPGWLFALRKCWDYKWPDPFVKPLPRWDLTGINRPILVEREATREADGNRLGFPSAPRRHGS